MVVVYPQLTLNDHDSPKMVTIECIQSDLERKLMEIKEEKRTNACEKTYLRCLLSALLLPRSLAQANQVML